MIRLAQPVYGAGECAALVITEQFPRSPQVSVLP